MVNLMEIDRENFWDIIALEVEDEQNDLVTSNAVSIAQSKVQPECVPLAIYHSGEPVGFVMYCIDCNDDEYWIYRLMIDKRFQNRGFGKRALELVLDEIKKDKTRSRVFLGVDPAGAASVRVYEALGFKFTGEVYGKERIMVHEY